MSCLVTKNTSLSVQTQSLGAPMASKGKARKRKRTREKTPARPSRPTLLPPSSSARRSSTRPRQNVSNPDDFLWLRPQSVPGTLGIPGNLGIHRCWNPSWNLTVILHLLVLHATLSQPFLPWVCPLLSSPLLAFPSFLSPPLLSLPPPLPSSSSQLPTVSKPSTTLLPSSLSTLAFFPLSLSINPSFTSFIYFLFSFAPLIRCQSINGLSIFLFLFTVRVSALWSPNTHILLAFHFFFLSFVLLVIQ